MFATTSADPSDPHEDRNEPAAETPPGPERELTVVSPKINLRQRVRAIWRYRELLLGMTRKELRVQYKDSVLGFLWSMLNPAVTLLVYIVVFQVILKNGIPQFGIYLMCGVLVWNFFTASVSGACGSVVSNAGIIKKVAFPREIPALAQIGSAFVQMGLQALVLALFLIIFRHGPAIEYLPLVLPALLALVMLATSLGILLAAVNVRMRDTQHLLNVGLQVWFWGTPIVYTFRLVRDRIQFHDVSLSWLLVLYRLNPVTPIVLSFQRAIYGKTSPKGAGGKPVNILPDHADPWWYLWQLLLVMAFSAALLVYGLTVFAKREGSFAEEL